jgi:protoporphyrinogen oxidase
MGLGVAYQLARDGYRPVVFEADDRVGGMAATFDFGGMALERYYHFHCVSDSDFLTVLDELGLADRMRWTETKMAYWYRDRLQPWGNPVALLKFKGLSLGAKFRYGLHALVSVKRNDWRPLDHVEATGWLKRWVGQEAYEAMWRPLFQHKFHEHAGSLSAAWIWTRIRRIGRSRYDILREKLGYLEGGSETLLHAMCADIEANGGEIRLGSPVSRIVLEGGRVRGVEVAGGFEAFDTVISTIPAPYVPDLIPDLPADLLSTFRSLRNIAVVCVVAKLRRALTDCFWVNTNDPEMDVPGLVEYTRLRPMGDHIVYVPYYLPGEHETYGDPDRVFIDKVRRYLKKIDPALADADIVDMCANRYRFAQPICNPGYLDTLPPAGLPVEGLWVADTSYYYPEDRGLSESIGFGRRMAREATL